MTSLKDKLLNNWHLMRIVRLAIGIWLEIIAFSSHDWPIGFMGAFFLYQAIADTSCCGAAGCNTSYSKRTSSIQKTEQIEFEEIK